jgi:hypothetical protein
MKHLEFNFHRVGKDFYAASDDQTRANLRSLKIPCSFFAADYERVFSSIEKQAKNNFSYGTSTPL